MQELKQTWSCLNSFSTRKDIILFGIGAFTNIFFSKCTNYNLIGVFDNDHRKQGKTLFDILGKLSNKYADLIVKNPKYIQNYSNKNKIIVVIASKHDKDIIAQLKKEGFTNFFSVLEAEKNEADEDYRHVIAKKYASLPIKRNKICIMMGNYGGHGLYITKELLRRNLNIDIVWILRNPKKEIPTGVRTIYDGDWEQYYSEIETAKIWIFDNLIPEYVIKREMQIYIQVKHWSSITLKKFYMDDMAYAENSQNRELSKKNAEEMDYIFSGSKFDEQSCCSGFLFKGKFVRVGSARSDALFDTNISNIIYQKFNINSMTKILLYAPTYRDGCGNETRKSLFHSLDFSRLKSVLEKKFGGNWMIFLRLHPSEVLLLEKKDLPHWIENVSFYEDVQELIAASDCVLTDYSSLMFEPAYVGKKVFLFAPDKENYINNERELLINYNTLPFSVAETNEQLENNINEFDYNDYKKKISSFFCEYGVQEDGYASSRAADFIEKLIVST